DSESESGADMDCRLPESDADAVLERVADIQLDTEAQSELEMADGDSETMSLSAKSTSANLLSEKSNHESHALDPGVVSSPLTSARLPDKLDQMRIDMLPTSPAQAPDEFSDVDVENSEASVILPDPNSVTSNVNTERGLSAIDMDTDAKDLEPTAVTPKPKRRIAPMLVTTELSNNPTGNIIDQCGEEDNSLGPPAPVQSSRRTRDLLRLEFHSSTHLFEPRVRAYRIQNLESNMIGLPTSDFLDTAGDAFWFCRYHSCRMTSENIEQTKDGKCVALWNRMLHVQALQRHLVCDNSLTTEADDAEDPVLPLYGESDDDGELSDGLMREIAKEQND
ncbi:hypothetical protein GGH12_006289, partial [Coemansia sp. RSA 1822]